MAYLLIIFSVFFIFWPNRCSHSDPRRVIALALLNSPHFNFRRSIDVYFQVFYDSGLPVFEIFKVFLCIPNSKVFYDSWMFSSSSLSSSKVIFKVFYAYPIVRFSMIFKAFLCLPNCTVFYDF